MKSYTLKIVFAIAFVIFGCYFYWYFTNVSYSNIFDAKTEIKTDAEKLVASFISDQKLANTTYVEKTVEIQGIIKDISFLNNRSTLFLEAGKYTTKNSIICDMQTNQKHNINKLKLGDSVLIKGIFKGFLMDGIMLNCVLLKKKINEPAN